MTYPIYQFRAHGANRGLFCFKSKSEMFRIVNKGSNVGNDGIVVDHYITRKMVLKHLGDGTITRDEFIQHYNDVFNAIKDNILY